MVVRGFARTIDQGQVRGHAAKAVGVGGKLVDLAEKLLRSALPELARLVECGARTLKPKLAGLLRKSQPRIANKPTKTQCTASTCRPGDCSRPGTHSVPAQLGARGHLPAWRGRRTSNGSTSYEAGPAGPAVPGHFCQKWKLVLTSGVPVTMISPRRPFVKMPPDLR